jgi:hypothetical protein
MSALTLLGLAASVPLVVLTLVAYYGADSSQGQTRRSAIIEVWINTSIGFGINYAANFVLLPLVGATVNPVANLWLGLIYTSLSVARGYAVRRWFNNRIHRAASWLAGGAR